MDLLLVKYLPYTTFVRLYQLFLNYLKQQIRRKDSPSSFFNEYVEKRI